MDALTEGYEQQKITLIEFLYRLYTLFAKGLTKPL